MSYEHNNNNLILQFKGKIIINIVVIKKNYDKKKINRVCSSEMESEKEN